MWRTDVIQVRNFRGFVGRLWGRTEMNYLSLRVEFWVWGCVNGAEVGEKVEKFEYCWGRDVDGNRHVEDSWGFAFEEDERVEGGHDAVKDCSRTLAGWLDGHGVFHLEDHGLT